RYQNANNVPTEAAASATVTPRPCQFRSSSRSSARREPGGGTRTGRSDAFVVSVPRSRLDGDGTVMTLLLAVSEFGLSAVRWKRGEGLGVAAQLAAALA